jgi:hypothetical protein
MPRTLLLRIFAFNPVDVYCRRVASGEYVERQRIGIGPIMCCASQRAFGPTQLYSISNIACAPDDLEVAIVSHRPRRWRQVPTNFRVQISRHECLSSRVGVICKRVTGQLKSRWQNILCPVHGRMPLPGVQDVAPCKLFSRCFFLGSYEVSAREDDKKAELPHVRMILEQLLNCFSTVLNTAASCATCKWRGQGIPQGHPITLLASCRYMRVRRRASAGSMTRNQNVVRRPSE